MFWVFALMVTLNACLFVYNLIDGQEDSRSFLWNIVGMTAGVYGMSINNP